MENPNDAIYRYKLLIRILLIILLLLILCAIIVGCNTKEDIQERSIFVSVILSIVSAVSSLTVGIIALRQNKIIQLDNANYREQLASENAKNRKQDLMIKTTPYLSFKGCDSIDINNNIFISENESELVALNGKFAKNNFYSGVSFRLIVDCHNTCGLRNIDFNEIQLITDFKGNGKYGQKYIFENYTENRKGDISIKNENQYQCLMVLGQIMDNNLESHKWIYSFKDALCDGINFFNIKYTAFNIYGVQVNGEIKFLCNINKLHDDELTMENISNISNWITKIDTYKSNEDS